jgi:tetratricopeptide (TPR) repeat protein
MPRSLLLAACLALTLPVHGIDLPKATEKWVALHVEDFRFISSVSSRETLKIARDLLRMRAAVGEMTAMKVHTAEPTRVFIFPNERRFAAYCEATLRAQCENVFGIFVATGSGNFILVRGDDKGGVGRIVYHELTHHFVANSNWRLPLWFNEGYAEFYSTFRTAGANTHIGFPINEHLDWLARNDKLIPLRELFTITTASPIYNEKTRMGVFYAQSWALVHYLSVDAKRKAKLRTFLSLLGDGKPLEAAFDEAFGVTFAQLEKELRAYIRGASFTYLIYSLGELTIPEVPEPAAMAHDEVLHQLGRLVAYARPENAALGERFFKESLALNEKNAGALANLARVYESTGRKAEADAAFAKAMALGRDDADVYLLAGRSLLDRGIDEFAKARPIYQRATELAPNSAAAWTGLGATYVIEKKDLAPGIAALEKAIDLAPNAYEAAFYLAQLWANDGRLRASHKLATSLREMSSVPETMKGQLATLLTWIDDRESTLRALTTINKAVDKANAGKYVEALLLVDAALPDVREEEVRKRVLVLRDEMAAGVARTKK